MSEEKHEEKERKHGRIRSVRLEDRGLNAYELKLLAIFTMAIDHTAYMYYWQIGTPTALILRFIGRFTFPIMAFLITEGFIHTKNRYMYCIRLLVCGLISMVPFDLLFGDPYNVMFTLAAGLLILILQDLVRERFSQVNPFVWMGVFFVVAVGASLLMREFDWGLPGILAIYITGQLKRFPYYVQGIACTLTLFAVSIIRTLIEYGHITSGNLLFYLGIPVAAVWIALYNGNRGRSMKYFFYAFYPLHLLLLYGITKVF